MDEPFVIRTGDDVVEAIRLTQEGVLKRIEDVHFDGYRLEIVIRGEDFEGGVPTRIMPGLIEVQKAVNKGYSRLLYGEERRLTAEERKRAELIVRVEPGSTRFAIDLTEVLNTVLKAAGKMESHHSLIAILGVAAVVGTIAVFKGVLNDRASRRDVEQRALLTEKEAERFDAVMELASKNVDIAAQLLDQEKAQIEIVKRLEPGDRIVDENNETIVAGSDAKRIASKPREDVEMTEHRMSGIFRFMSVDSGNVKHGLRAVIRDMKTGEEMKVTIPEGAFAQNQIDRLQDAEWGKGHIDMDILVRRKGKRFLSASLLSVAGQDDPSDSSETDD